MHAFNSHTLSDSGRRLRSPRLLMNDDQMFWVWYTRHDSKQHIRYRYDFSCERCEHSAHILNFIFKYCTIHGTTTNHEAPTQFKCIPINRQQGTNFKLFNRRKIPLLATEQSRIERLTRPISIERRAQLNERRRL